MLLQENFVAINKLQDLHNNVYYNIKLILLNVENNKEINYKFLTTLNNKSFKKQKLTIL